MEEKEKVLVEAVVENRQKEGAAESVSHGNRRLVGEKREGEEEKKKRMERQAETDERGSSGYHREFRLLLWCRWKARQERRWRAGLSRCKRQEDGSSSVGWKNKTLWTGLGLV